MEIRSHSLILLLGPDPSIKHAWAHDHFSPHQILSLSQIRQELTGDCDSTLSRHLVRQELAHRVEVRLSLGQQVVINWEDPPRVDVHSWATMCESLGAWLYVVTFDHKITTSKAKVLDHKQFKASCAPITQVLAVGDVHGDYAAMKMAYDYAQGNNLHVVWLGDVLDYGDHNLKCVHLAYQSVASGKAHMIWGNHERKIGKWVDGNMGEFYRGRLSDANKKTIQEIESLAPHRQRRFLAAWKFLEHVSTQTLHMKDWMFTHGAIHPDAWSQTSVRLNGVAGEWAYYGEVNSPLPNAEGYPQRVWSWVEQLPPNAKVVVGHDWVDRDHMNITVKTGAQGAQVWCVDTGSSKGGHLSALQIDLNTNKWEAKVFIP